MSKYSVYQLTCELDHIIRKKNRLQKEFDALDAWMKTPIVDDLIKAELMALSIDGNDIANKLIDEGMSATTLSEFITACNGQATDKYINCEWCNYHAPVGSWRHQAFYKAWDDRHGIPF